MPPVPKLRFTGTLPTKRAVERFPNWVLALDEEGEPGQDETTLRPDDEQGRISKETVCAAVAAEGPDGKRQLGMLYGYLDLWRGPEHADWLHVFKGARRLDVKLLPKLWWPHETAPTLHYNDFAVLPLRVITVLPGARMRPYRLTLMPGGSVEYGHGAKNARFVIPSMLRVGSLPRGSTMAPADRAEARMYSMRGKRRRLIGRATRVATPVAGTNAMRVFTTIRKTDPSGDIRIDETVVFDVRTLEALARSGMANGRRFDFALRRPRRTRLPRATFGDYVCLMQSLELSRGMRFAAPFFLMAWEETRNVVFEVEAREPAPGHRGSSAWRVRSQMGGPLVDYVWIDTRTRALLATRSTARTADFDELCVYQR